MEDFQAFLTATVNIFKTPITLYGFTFDFWQVFLFGLVASIVIWFVNHFFGD